LKSYCFTYLMYLFHLVMFMSKHGLHLHYIEMRVFSDEILVCGVQYVGLLHPALPPNIFADIKKGQKLSLRLPWMGFKPTLSRLPDKLQTFIVCFFISSLVLHYGCCCCSSDSRSVNISNRFQGWNEIEKGGS
jgi:hypothetical protein